MDIITPRQAAEWIPEDHNPAQPYTIADAVALEPLFKLTVNGVPLRKVITRRQLEQIENWNQDAGVFGRTISKLTQATVTAYRVTSIKGTK